MTRFAAQFNRSAAPNLIRQFGECVTYYASGATSGREIMAIVERDAPEFTLRVRNSDRDGISSDELDTGGDEISFPIRIGETASRRSLVRLLDDSNGMTRVICE